MSALGRPANSSERRAAISSIKAQLQAFKKNDYARAMFYQASALKNNFPNPEAFRSMIQNGYPEFANYKSVEFGPARADKTGERISIPLTLTGMNGSKVRALYLMVREHSVYHVAGVEGGTHTAPPPNLPSGSLMDA